MRIVTVAEAAPVIGRRTPTIYEWLRRGRLVEYIDAHGRKCVDLDQAAEVMLKPPSRGRPRKEPE
jgi:hypothetical protein